MRKISSDPKGRKVQFIQKFSTAFVDLSKDWRGTSC